MFLLTYAVVCRYVQYKSIVTDYGPDAGFNLSTFSSIARLYRDQGTLNSIFAIIDDCYAIIE